MGVVIEVRPEDVARLVKETSEKARKAVRRGLVAGAHRGVTLLKSKSPVYDGLLRWGWKVVPGRTLLAPEIANTAPHAGIVEAGARPHPVSEEGIAALTEWVRRKIPLGTVSRGPRKGQPRLLRRGEASQEAERIAHAIAWKLRRKGQKGTFFVRDRLRTIALFTLEEIRAEVDAALKGS